MKGAMPHSSGVRWWLKKGWGQATGWDQCFVSFIALSLGWVTGRHLACKKPVSCIPKKPFWHEWRKKPKENWLTEDVPLWLCFFTLKKLIKIGWWSGWWVGECFFWYRLTWVIPDKGPKMVIVVVVYIFTFGMRHSWGEMYIGYGRLCVCLSLAAFPHCCMGLDVTWGNGRGWPLVVHCGQICSRCTGCVAMTTHTYVSL